MFIHNKIKFNRGFTLIEVIVSTLITGIILSSIFYIISFLNTNLDRLSNRNQNYSLFLTSLSIIEQDLKSLSARSIRDEYGDTEPPLILYNGNEKKITFSRLIFDDKNLLSHTYRIEYSFVDQVLKRNIWDVLDRVQDSKFQSQILDKNITDIQIQASNDELKWHNNWPIGFKPINRYINKDSIGLTTRNDIMVYQNSSSGKENEFSSLKLPLAFKINIKHKIFGEIERVILSQI
tara:strand:+ start:55 stop:759 length:705 start_codon:yes stop_codon:yes gene_type:complete